MIREKFSVIVNKNLSLPRGRLGAVEGPAERTTQSSACVRVAEVAGWRDLEDFVLTMIYNDLGLWCTSLEVQNH